MKFKTLLTGCSLLGIAACQTAAPTAGHADFATPLAMNSVRVLDQSLISEKATLLGTSTLTKIAIEREGLAMTPTGKPLVWVMMRNQTDHPLQLEGRVTWFDSNEMPVDGPTGWKRLMLPPNALATFKESSVVAGSAYYQVDVREGR